MSGCFFAGETFGLQRFGLQRFDSAAVYPAHFVWASARSAGSKLLAYRSLDSSSGVPILEVCAKYCHVTAGDSVQPCGHALRACGDA